MNLRHFFLRLSFFLPLILLFIGVEHAARTFVVFNKTEKAISDAFSTNKNVAFSFDYDDRVLQKLYINNLNEPKNVVVLGSSRSAKIDSAFFPNHSFFNNTVTGAHLEDYIAIYQLYKNNNVLPRTIILGLDPWALDKTKNPIRRWLSLHKEFYQFDKNISPLANPSLFFWYHTNKIPNTLFLPHLQFSIKKIAQNLLSHTEKKKHYVTNDTEGMLPIVHYDGSISESTKIRMRSAQEVREEISKQPDKCPAGWNGTIHQENAYLLTQFLQTAKKDGVQVVFWLAPLHPLAYEEVLTSPTCRGAVETEEYIRNLARDYGTEVVGSYNPYTHNLPDDIFYDSIHPKREAVKQIFEKDTLLEKISKASVQ